MNRHLHFTGLTVRPYNRTCAEPERRIDRVCVEVTRTLFGDYEYHVRGQLGSAGERFDLTPAYTGLGPAFASVRVFESKIEDAKEASDSQAIGGGQA